MKLMKQWNLKCDLWKKIKDKNELNRKIELNKLYFKNRLFICLTRGTKGAYVYFEDKKLEEYFKNSLGEFKWN